MDDSESGVLIRAPSGELPLIGQMVTDRGVAALGKRENCGDVERSPQMNMWS
jgi:hypothetical protein